MPGEHGEGTAGTPEGNEVVAQSPQAFAAHIRRKVKRLNKCLTEAAYRGIFVEIAVHKDELFEIPTPAKHLTLYLSLRTKL